MADGTDDLSQLFKDDLLGMDAGVGDAAAEEAARVALSNSMFAEDAAMEARAGRGGTPAPRARGGRHPSDRGAISDTTPPPRNPPPRAAPRVVPAPRPVDRDRDRRGPPRDDDRDFERDHHLDEMAQQFLDDHEHPEDEVEHQEWPSPAELLADARAILAEADAAVMRDGRPPPPEHMARLDRELRRVVERQRATADEDRKRHDLLRRFGAMLQRRFPGVALRPFGSFVSVFHTAGSDVDVSLEVAPNSPWYDPKEMGPGTHSAAGAKEGGRNNRRNQPPRGYKSKKVQLLSKVASELRFQKFADVRLVAHARVPLIKFHDPRTNVNCDVCVGNDGVYKSAVLGVLANLDERYRDLVHLVKMFAKNFDCNDALGGSFNSYSLSLMSLFHLQTRSPPILPPTLRLTLQSDAAADADLAAENERAANLEPIRKFPVSKIRQQSDQLRDVGPVERRAERYRGVGAENSATLAELFVTFFTHFRAVEPLWRHGLVASAYAGRWVAGCSWAPGRYCLGVEDPFAAGDNVARAVQRRSLPKVLAAIRDGTLAVARVAWARSDDDLQRALADLLGPDAAPPPEMPTQGWPSLGGDGGGENASAVNAAHMNAQHPLGHLGHPLGRPAPPPPTLLNLATGAAGPVAGGPGVSSEAFGMDRRAAAFGDRGAPPPGFAAPGGGGFLGGPPPPPAGLGGPPRFGFSAPGFGPPMGAPAPPAPPPRSLRDIEGGLEGDFRPPPPPPPPSYGARADALAGVESAMGAVGLGPEGFAGDRAFGAGDGCPRAPRAAPAIAPRH